MTTLSDAQIAAVAAQAGFAGESLVIAIAIAKAESSGNAEVINFLGCVGLWQIYQSVHAPAHPTWTTPWLQVPANNAVAAFALSSGGTNWQPWETYTNGMYLAYLDEAAVAAGAPDGTGVPTTEPTGATTPATATLALLTGAVLVSPLTDQIGGQDQDHAACVAVSPTRFVVGVVNGNNQPESGYDQGSVRYILVNETGAVLATTVLDWVDQEPEGNHGRSLDGRLPYIRAARIDDTHFLEWADDDWSSDGVRQAWVRSISIEGDTFSVDYLVSNPLPAATIGENYQTLAGSPAGRWAYVPSLGLMLAGSTWYHDSVVGIGLAALDVITGAPVWEFEEPASDTVDLNGPAAWSMILDESGDLLLSWAMGANPDSFFQRRYAVTNTALTPLGDVEPVTSAASWAQGSYFDYRYIFNGESGYNLPQGVRVPPAPWEGYNFPAPLADADLAADFLAGGMGIITGGIGDIYAAIGKITYTPATEAPPTPVDLGNSTSALDGTPQEPIVNFSPIS